MKPEDNIFVYGTLKTGHGANSILQGRAEFVNEDRISGTLYNLGAFPGFKTVGKAEVAGEPIPFISEGPTVKGEVWKIKDDVLPALLDRYEGYPSLYDRRRVQTERGDVAWVYEYHADYIDRPLVEGGEWH